MKLLTAIKKAQKIVDESNGCIECSIDRKYGLDCPHNKCWINIDLYGIQIDGEFKLDDLLAKDYIIKESK